MVRHGTCLLLLTVVLGATACGGDRGPDGETSGQASATVPTPAAVEVPGVPNARQAGDLLFGGQPDAATIERLGKEGYRTVVSTRGTRELAWDEKAAVEAAGMSFVFIAMDKPVQAITDEQLDAFDEAMQGAERPVLLHCSTGNRTAGLWAVWLAERRGVAPQEALRLGALAGMTRSRPVVEKRLGL